MSPMLGGTLYPSWGGEPCTLPRGAMCHAQKALYIFPQEGGTCHLSLGRTCALPGGACTSSSGQGLHTQPGGEHVLQLGAPHALAGEHGGPGSWQAMVAAAVGGGAGRDGGRVGGRSDCCLSASCPSQADPTKGSAAQTLCAPRWPHGHGWHQLH